MFQDTDTSTYGEANDKIYDDLEGVAEVTSLPDHASHRTVDQLVLAAGSQHCDRIKTAIVCPPTIYGKGRGPGNVRSHQVPALCQSTLEKGEGIMVGEGKTYWSNVNVHDLSALYLKLVEEAAMGGSTREWPGKPDVWGAKGYYFAENGEHVWGDVSRAIAAAAHKQGLIKSKDVKSYSAEEANKLTTFGAALWGANSRSRARRAKEVLKWEPCSPALEDEIDATLAAEARRLSITHGHAEVAAGNA